MSSKDKLTYDYRFSAPGVPLFAQERLLIKNFQLKQHNYGHVWPIVRFVSLLCPMPLNSHLTL